MPRRHARCPRRLMEHARKREVAGELPEASSAGCADHWARVKERRCRRPPGVRVWLSAARGSLLAAGQDPVGRGAGGVGENCRDAACRTEPATKGAGTRQRARLSDTATRRHDLADSENGRACDFLEFCERGTGTSARWKGSRRPAPISGAAGLSLTKANAVTASAIKFCFTSTLCLHVTGRRRSPLWGNSCAHLCRACCFYCHSPVRRSRGTQKAGDWPGWRRPGV